MVRLFTFFIVFLTKRAHTSGMTTTIKLSGLGGWLGRCLSVAIAFAFCASAFAEPNKNAAELSKQSVKKGSKICYTYISNSGIPQPCDRLGAIPTTATPILILGGHSPDKTTR
jgi:hypothetical protein